MFALHSRATNANTLRLTKYSSIYPSHISLGTCIIGQNRKRLSFSSSGDPAMSKIKDAEIRMMPEVPVQAQEKDATWTSVSLVDLPMEIFVQIYLDLESYTDIVSLSSTCKIARHVFKYDYRIEMRDWPEALGLLQLHRRGALPDWKERKLRSMLCRLRPGSEAGGPKFDFLVPDTRRSSSDSSNILSGNPGFGSEAREILSRNHAYIMSLVTNHGKFETRITYTNTLSIPGLILFGSMINANVFREAVKPSLSERRRMMRTSYMAATLQLQTCGFSRYNSGKGSAPTRTNTAMIFDYAPVLKLTFRECLELMVLLRVLFVEARPATSWAAARADTRFAWEVDYEFLGPITTVATSDKKRHQLPLFYTQNLLAVFTSVFDVIHVRLEAIQNLYERGYRGFQYSYERDLYADQNFFNIGSVFHPMRSIFWDQNQPSLSRMFTDIHSRITASTSGDAATIILPLPPGTIGEELRIYAKNFSTISMQSGSIYRLDLQAVRVDKHGVINFDKDGPVDNTAKDGRWGVFRKADLRRLHKTRFPPPSDD